LETVSADDSRVHSVCGWVGEIDGVGVGAHRGTLWKIQGHMAYWWRVTGGGGVWTEVNVNMTCTGQSRWMPARKRRRGSWDDIQSFSWVEAEPQ